MKILEVALVVVSLLAVAGWTMLLYRNPLPFPDRGHRCFPVPNELAARVVVDVLGSVGGLPERFTFTSGETDQTLLWDNTTVLIQYGAELRKRGLAIPALSVAVADPPRAAEAAKKKLEQDGFIAEVVHELIPDMEDKMVGLKSNAFGGWFMIFRKPLLQMGEMPKTRKITSD